MNARCPLPHRWCGFPRHRVHFSTRRNTPMIRSPSVLPLEIRADGVPIAPSISGMCDVTGAIYRYRVYQPTRWSLQPQRRRRLREKVTFVNFSSARAASRLVVASTSRNRTQDVADVGRVDRDRDDDNEKRHYVIDDSLWADDRAHVKYQCSWITWWCTSTTTTTTRIVATI